ncbi:hypothetical protein ADUPG1_003927 [Aduncisulcus paluster]|uniref:Uncharacterized protein n=1 Tax=Aduncisulcus paluster TaxID=2918883 RepID=A0ABQ5JV30_9EUKA|nr:hypothetical protein ADUPG1_003927 [Aduncisulcus paluster]
MPFEEQDLTKDEEDDEFYPISQAHAETYQIELFPPHQVIPDIHIPVDQDPHTPFHAIHEFDCPPVYWKLTYKNTCEKLQKGILRRKSTVEPCSCLTSLHQGDSYILFFCLLHRKFIPWPRHSVTPALLFKRGYCGDCFQKGVKFWGNNSRHVPRFKYDGLFKSIFTNVWKGFSFEQTFRKVFLSSSSSSDRGVRYPEIETEILECALQEMLIAKGKDPITKEIVPMFKLDVPDIIDDSYRRDVCFMFLLAVGNCGNAKFKQLQETHCPSFKGIKKGLYVMYFSGDDEFRTRIYDDIVRAGGYDPLDLFEE